MFTTVIVPLNGSEFAAEALGPAQVLARQAGAELEVITVTPHWGRSSRQEYLAGVAAELDVPTKTKVLVDAVPDEEIVAEANRRPGALICMRSHGRGRVGQALLGAVTAAVVREYGAPVVAVGPNCAAPPSRYTEMVLPVDAAAPAASAIELATAWARALELRVIVVQVVDTDAIDQVARAGVPTGDVVESGHTNRLAHELDAAGVQATWETLHDGDPARGIVSYLLEHPDAIVAMTTHGRAGWDLMTAGSVATGVVHGSPCPVLLLRSHAAAAAA
jgi:nucleotide-binding universal stress UspA family protein